ncbi:MAG: hypothetical protein JO092_06675 [Candidatus Eremiobacteraeota bacterium]|nr:hypothetical protein [Candidatus Eremiobacteraeota bacterium]
MPASFAAPAGSRVATAGGRRAHRPWEIDEAQRRFDAAREAFLLAEPKDLSPVRLRILGSWQRSRSVHIEATLREAPLALPFLSRLELPFGEMGFCIGIADPDGRILYERGERRARTLVERAGIVPGADLSENAVGTNGVGTVIADRRPSQITRRTSDDLEGLSLTSSRAGVLLTSQT